MEFGFNYASSAIQKFKKSDVVGLYRRMLTLALCYIEETGAIRILGSLRVLLYIILYWLLCPFKNVNT